MPLNRDGTRLLQMQALRNRVTDLEAELDDTRVLLRVTKDQRDRRQLTADALRHALSDRTQPVPDTAIDDVTPVMNALRSERKLRKTTERTLKRREAELRKADDRVNQLLHEREALQDELEMWRNQAFRKSKALAEANQTTSRLALVLSERTN